MLGHVGPPVAPRPIDQPVRVRPVGIPSGRVDPPITPRGLGRHSPVAPGPPPQPGMTWEQQRPNFYHWAQHPVETTVPGQPGVPLPFPGQHDPGHPVAMLQQAAGAHARQFRNQMMQVAPLINDPGFHALLNAPVSLQNHAAAYQWFQGLAQQHGFPDVQSLINALIQHRASA